MKTYWRRLWAALCGREYVPLHVGSTFAVRGPGGEHLRFEVTGVSIHRDFTATDTLQIECQSPARRMVR